MKYIDADKLRKLLANRYEEITVPVLTDEGGLESFYRRSEIHNILKIVDSLQQEPIEKDEDAEKLIICDIMEATIARIKESKVDKEKEENIMMEKITYLRNLGLKVK